MATGANESEGLNGSGAAPLAPRPARRPSKLDDSALLARASRAVEAAKARVETARSALSTAEADLATRSRELADARRSVSDRLKKVLTNNLDSWLADPKKRKQITDLLKSAETAA